MALETCAQSLFLFGLADLLCPYIIKMFCRTFSNLLVLRHRIAYINFAKQEICDDTLSFFFIYFFYSVARCQLFIVCIIIIIIIIIIIHYK